MKPSSQGCNVRKLYRERVCWALVVWAGWRVWVGGLAGLVGARGGLARTRVSNTEALTKGSGST